MSLSFVSRSNEDTKRLRCTTSALTALKEYAVEINYLKNEKKT